ncbi:MAG: helix-turn-helix domain-containing protein [Anaerolineales bacterium]|jgi:transposase|nr:helix-turn-helix domain-containing protein [Anaerolineales bacterium]
MRPAVKLRSLTTEEETEIRRIAASRKEAYRLVQRAKVIVAMLEDPRLRATQAGLRVGFRGSQSGLTWVKRFNEKGLAGLGDKPKPGRPPIHDQKVRSALISLAQQKPDTLGYPFKLWTLERLQTAFKEREGVHLSDSTIWEWVEGEGFKWKRQQSWFHEAEKHDPEFVEKRGAS